MKFLNYGIKRQTPCAGHKGVGELKSSASHLQPRHQMGMSCHTDVPAALPPDNNTAVFNQ